jgi:thioredoxin 1
MKYIFTTLTALFILITYNLASAEGKAFDETSFDNQLKTGKSILVAVHAPWCSTCKAQAPILKKILGQKEFHHIYFMQVDFDSQKEILKKLNVQRQSTLIVFKGGKEVGRSLGDTTDFGIESLLQKAI